MIVNTSKVGLLGMVAAMTAMQACAPSTVGAPVAGGGGSGGAGSGPGNRDGGATGSGGISLMTSININFDAPPPEPDLRKADSAPDTGPFAVDDAGNPVCLSILSVGKTGTWSNGTDAFQTFMLTYTKNAKAGTVTTMNMLREATPLTEDLLKQYNVIILQALQDDPYTGLWEYQQSDVDALTNWVKAGGAIIAMSGYGVRPEETTALNQLLSFSGITYNKDDIFGTCPDSMCYCAHNTVAFDGWTKDYADYDVLTQNLKKVGVFHGRSISCTGSECQVFAKDPTYGNIGVAKVVGKGRVVAWADEWVTYTSQWGLDDPTEPIPAQCDDYTPRSAYSVPQFWYNIFFWSVPSMQWCFTVTVPPTAPPEQAPIPIPIL